MNQWYAAIMTAVFYLAVSIICDAWKWSWLIWVAYGLHRYMDKTR